MPTTRPLRSKAQLLPHLNTALGFVQAVQGELQVGAPSRHHAGAGHVAEFRHCGSQGRRESGRSECGEKDTQRSQWVLRRPGRMGGSSSSPLCTSPTAQTEGKSRDPAPHWLWKAWPAAVGEVGRRTQDRSQPAHSPSPGTGGSQRDRLPGAGGGRRGLENWALEPRPPLSCVSGLVITSPHGFQTREATCSSALANDLSCSSGISA